MKTGQWQWLKRMPEVLAALRAGAGGTARRQRRRCNATSCCPRGSSSSAIVLYHLYMSPWLVKVVDTYGVVFETIQNVFAAYAVLVLGGDGVVFRRAPFSAGIGPVDGVCRRAGGRRFLAG